MKQKKKLVSATLSLIVATVLMSSSSYAWFTISTNPEISNIRTSITANENIEIALDNGYANAEAVDAAGAVINGLGQSGNPYTWGNLLDLSVAMTNIGGMLSLKPVGYSYDSVTNKVTMKTPEYGLDGRVARLNTMAQQYISAYNAITSPSGGVSVFKPSEDAATADALALSFWLRSNEDVSLKLSEGTYRADDGSNADGTVNAEIGGGSTLTMSFNGGSFADLNDDELGIIVTNLNMAAEQLMKNYFTRNSLYSSLWEEYYSDLNALNQRLSSSGLEIKVVFHFRVLFFGEIYDLTAEQINNRFEESCLSVRDLIRTGQFAGDENADCSSTMEAFYMDDIICECDYEIAPSASLLRFLDKVRIRLSVNEGGERKEYYARISDHFGPYEFRNTGETYQDNVSYDYIAYDSVGGTSRGESFNPYWYQSEIIRKEYEINPENQSISFGLELTGLDGRNENSTYVQELQKYNDMVRSHPNLLNIGSWDAHGRKADPRREVDAGIETLYNICITEQKRVLTAAGAALPHIDLTANEAKKVDVYVYLDGEAVTNADALLMDGIELSLNLQFEKIGGATNAMTAAEAESGIQVEAGGNEDIPME